MIVCSVCRGNTAGVCYCKPLNVGVVMPDPQDGALIPPSQRLSPCQACSLKDVQLAEARAEIQKLTGERDRWSEQGVDADALLGRDLVAVLSGRAGGSGQSEGAVECLQRIIKDRDDARSLLSEVRPVGERMANSLILLRDGRADENVMEFRRLLTDPRWPSKEGT
jgi:hypothetical protein